MARIIRDFVIETSTTTGTGNISLSGTVNSLRAFSSVCSTGDKARVIIKAIDGSGFPTGEWEISDCTYSSANTLTRDTVIASSNSNALVNFSAGTKLVYMGADATYLSSIREVLAADRTYYVRTDGSDSNTGLVNTSGGAFLTIQKAVDVVCDDLILNNKTVTIQVADGTYTGAIALRRVTGRGTAIIQGNSGTPANVVVSTTSASCITASQHAVWSIKDMKLQTTTSGTCIVAGQGSMITISGLNFGASAGGHIYSENSSQVSASGNYTISGNATFHVQASSLGRVNVSGRTLTISGTPAFSTAFAIVSDVASFYAPSNTYSGSATGTRYSVSLNGVINTGSGGANYFPGNAAGSATTGGQYA